MSACPPCSSTRTHKDGRDQAGTQLYRCLACRRSVTDRTGTPFTNHCWPVEHQPGAVARKGKETGVATPYHDTVFRMIRQIEVGERPLAWKNLDELRQRGERERPVLT